MTTQEINLFKKQGFVNFGSIIFSKEEVQDLKNIIVNVYNSLPKNHPDRIKDSSVSGIENLPLHDINLLKFINKIVSNTPIKYFLRDILGKDYKIWAINTRRASAGDPGLYMHQDGVGQVNMVINLDDSLDCNGVSAILPSSHLLLKSQAKLKVNMPRIFTNLFAFLFKPLSGSKGDILFFSNKAWHGRFKNKSNSVRDAIFIAFFPKGYRYNNPWPQDLINKNSMLYITNLLASPVDYKNSSKTSNIECRESGNIYYSIDHGYSMYIENYNHLIKESRPFKLLLSLLFIRCVVFFINILIIFFRFIIS